MAKLQDIYASGLGAIGYAECPSPSRKYRLFVKPDKPNVWLGRNGAVRIGKTVTGSAAMSDAGKARLADRASSFIS